MSKSRREFLTEASMAALAAMSVSRAEAQQAKEPPPGAPPAFGTAPPVGPEVSPATFAEAERLVRFEMTPKEREEAAGNWRSAMAQLYERRTGPHKVEIESSVAPYSLWNPILPGHKPAPQRDQFVRSNVDPGPLPPRDEDIAFAPVTKLSRWIQTKQLKSERLTNLYLDLIKLFDPKLCCVSTLTDKLALEQARRADQ